VYTRIPVSQFKSRTSFPCILIKGRKCECEKEKHNKLKVIVFCDPFSSRSVHLGGAAIMWPFTISEAERLRLIEEERRRNRWRKLKFWKRPPVKLLVPTVGQRCAACCLPALCILGSIYLIHQICIRKRKEKLKRSVRYVRFYFPMSRTHMYTWSMLVMFVVATCLYQPTSRTPNLTF
jgi:hypothetical protein